MELAFIGPVQIGVVMIVALIVLGPKRMPEVARQLGGFVRDIRKTMGQFTEAVEGVKADVGTHVDALPKFDQNHLFGSENLMKPYDQPTGQIFHRTPPADTQGLSFSTVPLAAAAIPSADLKASPEADAKGLADP